MSASPGDRSGLAFTVARPVATTMAVLTVVTFGFISFGKIPLALLPEISYPTVTVRTAYDGAGPEDIEERVSRRVEEALAVLPNLERYTSVSRAGVSDVVLEFRWGTNLSFATQEIRERLDRVALPDDADEPLILRYDPALDPVLRLAVAGEADLGRVRQAAEEEVARALATVSGVAAVKVRGGLEEEIRVRLDAKKLANLGLDISEVDRRLKIENVNLASGTLVEGDTEYVVRTLNQFRTLDDVLELAIVDRDGSPIRMRDLAVVERGHRERDVITRKGNRESVELLVHREADANIVDLARAVREKLFGTDADRAFLADLEAGRVPDPEVLLKQELLAAERQAAERPAGAAGTSGGAGGAGGFGGGPGMGGFGESERLRELRAAVARKRNAQDTLARKLPPGVEVTVLADQSVHIERAIADVRGAALTGGVLAVIVLLLFLRNAAATAIIGLSIPVSVIATFAPMFLLGTSLNIMSLGGLALGIGMLVDNAIVVLESIYRCREEGDRPLQAAVRGVREVGLAVVASTLTTVAVFFPIVFVSGVAGQVFGDQALTVVCSLLSSLAVALWFIPMLVARGLVSGKASARARLLAPLSALARTAAPLIFLRRSVTFRGAASAWRAAASPLRKAALALLLPLILLQFALEALGRLVLAALALLAFLVRLVLGAAAFSISILGWPFARAFDLAFGALAAIYPRVLGLVLRRPLAFAGLVVATLALAWAAAGAFRGLRREMLPTVHQGELVAHLFLPVGTPLERTAAVVAPLEERLAALPGVAATASAVGVPRDEVGEVDEGPHSARVLVRLAPAEDVAAAEEALLAKMRALLARAVELEEFRFSRPSLFSVAAPVAVEIRGNDLGRLRAAAADLEDRLRGEPALTDVRSSVQSGSPEVRLTFDREKLRRYGLDLEAISNRIRAQVQGVVSTRFVQGERRIDVRVQADVPSIQALSELAVNRGRAMDLSDTLDRGREGGGGSTGSGTANLRDRTLLPGATLDLGGDAPIPLSSVATLERVVGPAEIRRIDGQRAAVLSASVAGFDLGGATDLLQRHVHRLDLEHEGIVSSVGGQGAEMGGALDDMRMALLLAVFLVYIVMASQFESVAQPFVILLTIPLAVVGAVLALSWSGTALSVVVLIGAIVLAGIVVNNAIVLLDYSNQLRARGQSAADALIAAGAARLRPILMTVLTTVLGLLPLTGWLEGVPGIRALPEAFWRGSELQAPLAITVIGGLTFATVLTLLVIPALDHYLLRRRAASQAGRMG